MTRTRRARTAEREQEQAARRASLDVLFARADRGVLSRDEARLLRELVEAALDEGEDARRRARGQQAAVRRVQHRLAAAEQAIREIESERDHLAEVVEKLRAEQPAAAPWPNQPDDDGSTPR